MTPRNRGERPPGRRGNGLRKGGKKGGRSAQGVIHEFPKCDAETLDVGGTTTCVRVVCTSLDTGAKLEVKFKKADGTTTTETLTKAGTHTPCKPAKELTIHAQDGDATGAWLVCKCPE